jgi:hypothetical protein
MRRLFIRTAAGILAAALVLASCGNPGGGGGGGPDPVTAFNLTEFVTRPVKNRAPDTTAINEAQYTGVIVWQTQDGAPVTANFAASTVYKAVVTLSAKSGWTFDGVAADSFSYTLTGVTVTNTTGSTTVTVMITFPATTGADDPDPVTAFNLTGLVTAPARGETPDTTAIDEAQYTGSIAWQNSTGAAHSGAFAASTVYKAEVTLTAKTGWTFTGVGKDSFTYSGATLVTNAAGSGVVTITFPETEGGSDPDTNTEIPIGNPSVALYLDANQTSLTHNGSTDIDSGAGIFTVSIDDSGSYDEIIWYLNGNPQIQAQDQTSIVLSKQTPGTCLVTVEATPAEGTKNSGAHTFVVR